MDISSTLFLCPFLGSPQQTSSHVHLPECVTCFCGKACGTTYHALDQPLLVLLGLEMVTLKHQNLLEQSKPNEDLVRNKKKEEHSFYRLSTVSVGQQGYANLISHSSETRLRKIIIFTISTLANLLPSHR